MNIHQTALRMREQMAGFLGKLPVCKAARRFSLESLYGIATRQSVRLSEIARSLNEPIAMIKTENRLSRQAARPGLAEQITRFVIRRATSRREERRRPGNRRTPLLPRPSRRREGSAPTPSQAPFAPGPGFRYSVPVDP
jgi:hypothetical protein